MLPSYIKQVLPLFANSFDATLTYAAKISTISFVAAPIIGTIFIVPLLATTHFGRNRKIQDLTVVKYLFTPLAVIGAGVCLLGLIAMGTLSLCIILDQAHTLIFGRHAMNYRYVFFPLKLTPSLKSF